MVKIPMSVGIIHKMRLSTYIDKIISGYPVGGQLFSKTLHLLSVPGNVPRWNGQSGISFRLKGSARFLPGYFSYCQH